MLDVIGHTVLVDQRTCRYGSSAYQLAEHHGDAERVIDHAMRQRGITALKKSARLKERFSEHPTGDGRADVVVDTRDFLKLDYLLPERRGGKQRDKRARGRCAVRSRDTVVQKTAERMAEVVEIE